MRTKIQRAFLAQSPQVCNLLMPRHGLSTFLHEPHPRVHMTDTPLSYSTFRMRSTLQQNDPKLHRRDPLRNPEIDKPCETFDSENDCMWHSDQGDVRGGQPASDNHLQSLEPDVHQVPGETARSSLAQRRLCPDPTRHRG